MKTGDIQRAWGATDGSPLEAGMVFNLEMWSDANDRIGRERR